MLGVLILRRQLTIRSAYSAGCSLISQIRWTTVSGSFRSGPAVRLSAQRDVRAAANGRHLSSGEYVHDAVSAAYDRERTGACLSVALHALLSEPVCRCNQCLQKPRLVVRMARIRHNLKRRVWPGL